MPPLFDHQLRPADRLAFLPKPAGEPVVADAAVKPVAAEPVLEKLVAQNAVGSLAADSEVRSVEEGVVVKLAGWMRFELAVADSVPPLDRDGCEPAKTSE